MDNRQLTAICKLDPLMRSMFLGCFPADCLPLSMPEDTCLICNQDDSSLGGSHWLTVYHSKKDKKIYYIDSLGEKPKSRFIITCLSSYQVPIVYNNTPLQLAISNSCGLYCCVIVYFISRQYNPEQIIKTFFKPNDLLFNDLLVKNLSLCVFHLPHTTSLIDIEKLLKYINKNERQ